MIRPRLLLLFVALLLCSQLAATQINEVSGFIPPAQMDFFSSQVSVKLNNLPAQVKFGQKLNGTVMDPNKLGVPGVTKGTSLTVVFKTAEEAILTVKGQNHTYVLKDGKWVPKK